MLTQELLTRTVAFPFAYGDRPFQSSVAGRQSVPEPRRADLSGAEL